jgi:hypothetical protein
VLAPFAADAIRWIATFTSDTGKADAVAWLQKLAAGRESANAAAAAGIFDVPCPELLDNGEYVFAAFGHGGQYRDRIPTAEMGCWLVAAACLLGLKSFTKMYLDTYYTPMQYAAFMRPNLAKALVKFSQFSGVDVGLNHVDKYGRSALHYAIAGSDCDPYDSNKKKTYDEANLLRLDLVDLLLDVVGPTARQSVSSNVMNKGWNYGRSCLGHPDCSCLLLALYVEDAEFRRILMDLMQSRAMRDARLFDRSTIEHLCRLIDTDVDVYLRTPVRAELSAVLPAVLVHLIFNLAA